MGLYVTAVIPLLCVSLIVQSFSIAILEIIDAIES